MSLSIKNRTTGNVIAAGEESKTVRVFEGNWYFAPETVNTAGLEITERTYTCPYKGVCYWIDLVGADGSRTQNVGWIYRQPKAGYEFIQDQYGFYARPTAGTVAERT